MKCDQLYHQVDPDTIIFVAKPQTSFAFRGRVEVQVLFGCINVHGYDINSKSGTIPIISSTAYCAYTINVLENDGTYARKKVSKTLKQLNVDEKKILRFYKLGQRNCVILIRRYDDLLSNTINNVHPRLFVPKTTDDVISFGKKETKINFLHFISVMKKSVIMIPDNWYELLDKLQEAYMQLGSNLRIVICGGKNSGKSTLMTFLINGLLNECDGFYHLECDPGQPEFVPSGCLALTVIDKPVLEPTFLHQKKPLCCYSAGGTNVTPFPEHYVNCVGELHKKFTIHYAEEPKPLLINTMGFLKGVGLHLLRDIFTTVQPTHVIQLHRDSSNIAVIPKQFTSDNLMSEIGWSAKANDKIPLYEYIPLEVPLIDGEMCKKAKNLRNIGIYSYFASSNRNLGSKFILNSVTPYKVAFGDVALFCCNVTVANHEIMYAMNCSVVALCKSNQIALQESPATENCLPKFLDKMPDAEWIGYGIIRGIDMKAKAFYVITPVAQEDLMEVNILLKTEIDLPEEIIVNQDSSIPPPYVVCNEVKKSLIGSRVVQKRKFRERN